MVKLKGYLCFGHDFFLLKNLYGAKSAPERSTSLPHCWLVGWWHLEKKKRVTTQKKKLVTPRKKMIRFALTNKKVIEGQRALWNELIGYIQYPTKLRDVEMWWTKCIFIADIFMNWNNWKKNLCWYTYTIVNWADLKRKCIWVRNIFGEMNWLGAFIRQVQRHSNIVIE